MASKSFLLFALLATIALFVTSHVAASNALDAAHTEVKGVEDAKYSGYQGGGGYPGGGGYQGGGGYPGGGGYQGGGGYPGGGGYQGGGGYPGGGGYQGGGGGRGGYCRYGCCGRHNYRGVCLRCCGVEAQVEAKPHN
ncbi:hypothetical protein vseg_018097 [Gypsophila vaccaria]